MKNKFYLIIILISGVGLSGCKKDAVEKQQPSVPPTASFSVLADTLNNVITIGTYDQVAIINTSAGASLYLWNFGNDSTSTSATPVLQYQKSGTYTITLTVQNKSGQKASITKTLKVLDRVLKQVIINSLVNFNTASSANMSKADVWAVIKLGGNNSVYPFPVNVNSTFDAPVVFKSPTIVGLDISKLPYTINVPNKIILNFPALATLQEQNLGYKGIGYGLELYGQDTTNTYLLSSSYQYFYRAQSGAITWPVADIKNNIFIVHYGDIDLVCDYE